MEDGNIKDLGLIMSDDLTFDKHNKTTISTSKITISWILHKFKVRDITDDDDSGPNTLI